MQYYLEEKEKVLEEVKSSENGLTSEEAKKRQEVQGKNKLAEEKRDGIFVKIIKSILDPMIIMLLTTAVISAIVAKIQGDSFTDVFIILYVVIINTTGSTYKYDVLSGFVDLSAYELSANLVAITNGEIDTIVGDSSSS